MKTLQEIKYEYAINNGFKNWDEFCICVFGSYIGNTLDFLFLNVSKQALINASENVRMKMKENPLEIDLIDDLMEIDKESIISESNIPSL